MPSPKTPTSQSSEPVDATLRGKRDFADAIKVRVLRGGECPGWSRWVQENREFYKRRGRRIREETGDVVMEARSQNDAGM